MEPRTAKTTFAYKILITSSYMIKMMGQRLCRRIGAPNLLALTGTTSLIGRVIDIYLSKL